MYQHHFEGASHDREWRADSGLYQQLALPRVTAAVALFADIVGYTAHCESLDPEEAYFLLADFYRRASNATARHDAAIVDHFGDEVLAVWKGEVPLAVQAFRALRCALAILGEMKRWSEGRRRNNLNAIKVGIGIHAGPVLLGRPLASRRGGPSVFGDTVNIASRLERQTRILDTDLVISEELFQLAADVAGDTTILDHFPSVMSLHLSGRAKPLEVRPAVFRQRPSAERQHR
jgi:adenylate cyclase